MSARCSHHLRKSNNATTIPEPRMDEGVEDGDPVELAADARLRFRGRLDRINRL